MKIAIASDDERTIASHFGRTRGFIIVETDGKTIGKQEYRPNTFTGHARGMEGADHSLDRHAPILSALADCQVVISHGMGMRIYQDLSQANIKVFITEETDAQHASQLFIQGKLIDRPELGCDHSH
jgi:predicted Fe-Mo cluster-binding NifX family protein